MINRLLASTQSTQSMTGRLALFFLSFLSLSVFSALHSSLVLFYGQKIASASAGS